MKYEKENLVLLLDKTLPSGRYCIGRVVEEVKNPDGKARSFVVKHRGQLLTRSLMTLAAFKGCQRKRTPSKV